MLNFEQASDTTATATPHDEGTPSAARILEVAANTADQLVSNAHTEAESLVTAARATADALVETSRAEARQVTAGLADEKAALEAQIATLRQLQDDHRTQMRQHLSEQLSALDAAMPEPPAAVTG